MTLPRPEYSQCVIRNLYHVGRQPRSFSSTKKGFGAITIGEKTQQHRYPTETTIQYLSSFVYCDCLKTHFPIGDINHADFFCILLLLRRIASGPGHGICPFGIARNRQTGWPAFSTTKQ